jgi:PAS domain S-box-containing protein
MATITDITQRKRHEEELRKAEGQRDLLTRAVEEAGEAIIITDASGVILYVNPAFERITGYPGGEIVGQTPRILQSGKQDHDFYEQMWKTLKGGEIWHGRMINKRKDGSLYEEDSTIAPVKGPSGAIINYVEIQRDVTQQSQMEARMLQAAKMEALGQLAGGVAHDFNNQLTVIKGYCDILRNDLPPQSPVREPLEEIRRAAERSATLTSQLLSFSRKQMLFPRMVDLNVVLAEMTRTLGRMLGERIHVAAVCAANRPGVKADPGQLQQAIMNLAINARDAMPEGGRLTLETANVALDGPRIGPEADIPPGRYVMLAVTDTGTGMDAQTRKQVFEPFFTTKEVGKGTGLGLSMVHGFVQQSGGRITVYSEVGHGTTFRIYLPELPGVVAEAPPPQSQNDIRGDETILVTEDEASVRALLVRLLEGRGWHVLAAANAEEALHISDGHKGQIDLLITDVVMPGLGGPDLAGRLRETRPDLKVLFITGYAGNAAAEHKLTAAGSAILTKPFSADQFTRKVRELLGEPARK